MGEEVLELNEEEGGRGGRKPSPESSAGFLSRLFLVWVFGIVRQGWKKPLEEEDLWELGPRESAQPTSDEFQATMGAIRVEDEVRSAGGKGEGAKEPSRPAFVRAIFRMNRSAVLLSGAIKVVDIAFGQIQPVFVNLLLTWFSNPNASTGRGYLLATLLFLAPLLKSVLENQYFLLTQRTGLRIRATVQSAIYRKSLNMSPSARAGSSVGQIVNLMQLDAQRLADFSQVSHVTWAAPVQLVVSVALLLVYIGPAGAIGLLVTLLSFPLQGKLVRAQASYRKKNITITDERVKLTNEVLQGIKAVKFYAWEEPFAQLVEEIRGRELATIRMSIIVRSAFMMVLMGLPTIVAVVTFAFYSAVFNHALEPAPVFTALTLLNNLRIPIMMFPMVISSLIDARVSVRRIEHFLGLEETEERDLQDSAQAEISIQNGTFSWDSVPATLPDDGKREKVSPFKKLRNRFSRQKPEAEKDVKATIPHASSVVLNDIHLQVPAGKMTIVIGKVGSGKSSLVHAIIGEMKRLEGTVNLKGRVAYVPQSAWIFNGSLRENILFGEEFDEERYRTALRVSCLEEDLEVLPAKDMTAIGEKGINLSGGQKQRVSIARAVYANADIYLFDDPLSALDAHVGQTVFDACLSKKGYLANRTRLLVTNQLQFVPQGHHIVLLDKGRIFCQGSYKDLLETSDVFKQLMVESNTQAVESQPTMNSEADKDPKVEEPHQKAKIGGRGDEMMTVEERATGNISFKAYFNYARASGGIFVFSLMLLLFFVTVALSFLSTWWLSYWSQQTTVEGSTKPLVFFLGIYCALGIGYAILTFIRSAAYLLLALKASRALHSSVLMSVLRAPLSFFDTTPIGRMLSRFSRDVTAVDMLVPQAFQQMLNTVTNLVGSYIFISIITPIFIAAAVPIGFGYFILQRIFNRTNLEVKRLDSNSKSPIYAHFSETLGGLSSIRAYAKTENFKRDNMEKIDMNHRAYYVQLATNRWFALYLESLGSVLVLAASFLAVAGRGRLFAGNVGLSITFALQVTSFLGFAVRSITELESQMNSVERLVYYRDQLPQEASAEIFENKPPQAWPQTGEISFEGLQVRYRENLPLVLKGIDLQIPGGTKVGVVGRTGSGKSTLMVALLRLVEAAGGKVFVDGLDLGNLGLNDVRSKMTIIPQDPVIFSGTIRLNLDPFQEHADEDIWEALRKSNLHSFVSQMEGGLDAIVAEFGQNLSAGQRQLLCLARALLRKPKVLIMDEATSSVDHETDQLIQATVRQEFAECTILTIAHRLWTIADYDKVIVLDDGNLVEFDSPARLLENPGGRLSFLVDSLGPTGAENFRRIVTSRVEKV
eukprot:CAMPEP_0184682668 /NCGR_PEP_ID=MMETSP0312-20130426/8220_1 /TAXON_ID=31354 /ORGANISM="Compsopogon coeruleus, Strain SAG 36.94" /LENGTH=1331 /DNA_ID=CAMNT_0027134483 /DNA_START=219 /DNA_END=4214 /DNA_ORIENTATION=+